MQGAELMAMPHVALIEENNTRQGFVDRDQLEALLKHLPADLRPPVRFAYITGWRFASEVLNLQVARVDLQGECVRLEPGETKNGKGREIHFTDELRDILTKQLASVEALKKRAVPYVCSYVFHHADGSQIRNMRGAWEAAREAAGLPNALLHDFRRTAVRNLERAGVARTTAMEMVGHETQAIYERYAIQDTAMLREGAAKQDAWAKTQAASVEKGTTKGRLARFGRRKVG
jgi:integrase